MSIKSKNYNDKIPNQLLWNLSCFYSSDNDPKIEEDMQKMENIINGFAKKYDTADKKYLNDNNLLFKALTDFENISIELSGKPLYYFFYRSSIDSADPIVQSQIALLSNRVAILSNKIRFFALSIARIPEIKQKNILKDKNLAHFKYYLINLFKDAEHLLSLKEENILALKSLPSNEMWSTHTEKILNAKTLKWKGKTMPVSEAMNLVADQKTSAERRKLSSLINDVLADVAIFAEGEINAIYTDKKINDNLRGYRNPFDATVIGNENDPLVIDNLRKIVTQNFTLSERFYKLKAKLLKQDKLNYYDRSAKIGNTKSKYSIEESIILLKKTFGKLNPKFAQYIDRYITNGEIDSHPRQNKQGGAFCSSSFEFPTFVLLNHVDTLHSFTTMAHELGHAFHGEMSKSQGVLYCDYSTSLAETASTLFESIALESIFENLSDKEKIIVLHDKINDEISTIFRQIACFNFELSLHNSVRSKGFLSKEEIADLHNQSMQEYLGPIFKLNQKDGYMFVSWSHIRRFFYVYTYAYGMLLSKALLRKYREDPKFWTKIEHFLSSGGKDTPENIMKEIGIDLTKPDFFMEGIREIEKDIEKLEKLTEN